jgi:hypothetical protein
MDDLDDLPIRYLAGAANGRDLFAAMTQLVTLYQKDTGIDPRVGGYAFVVTHGAALALVEALTHGRAGSRLIQPAGRWDPPDGVRGQVFGWLEGIVILERAAACDACELLRLEDLRRADAAAEGQGGE